MIVPSKHPNQARTLKLHVKLYHNQHRGKVATLQRLRSTILLPKLFHKTNLVIPEAANTTYALILILNTQKYKDIDVCKILFQPLLCALLILQLYVCRTHIIQFFFFLFWGQYLINTSYEHIYNTLTKTAQ